MSTSPNYRVQEAADFRAVRDQNREHGLLIIEFAMVVVILLVMIFAVIEFSWRIYTLEHLHFFANEEAKLASRECGRITFSNSCLQGVRDRIQLEASAVLPGFQSTVALYQVTGSGVVVGGDPLQKAPSSATFTYNFPNLFSSVYAAHGNPASPDRYIVAVEAVSNYSPIVVWMPRIFEHGYNGMVGIRTISLY